MLLLPITTIPLGKQHVWLCVISAPHYDFKLIFHEETYTSHSCMLESVVACLLSVKSDCLGSALLLRGITLDQCPTLLHIQISHFHRGTRKVASHSLDKVFIQSESYLFLCILCIKKTTLKWNWAEFEFHCEIFMVQTKNYHWRKPDITLEVKPVPLQPEPYVKSSSFVASSQSSPCTSIYPCLWECLGLSCSLRKSPWAQAKTHQNALEGFYFLKMFKWVLL